MKDLKQSSLKDKELEWIHLIAKNQDKSTDHDISRFINSFLYSRKKETAIVRCVLNIIYGLICVKTGNHKNCVELSEAIIFDKEIGKSIPKALVAIFVKEIGNSDIIRSCLDGLHMLLWSLELPQQYEMIVKFERVGIYEALMSIMKIYMHDDGILREVLCIIDYLVINEGYRMERFLRAGLLQNLAENFEFPNHIGILRIIVRGLKVCDASLVGQLHRISNMPDRSLASVANEY
jgi:hypothetical protein